MNTKSTKYMLAESTVHILSQLNIFVFLVQ